MDLDFSYSQSTPKSDAPFPVSIVICARDEAENLRRHLPLWLAQAYAGDWELLIVDDASEDDTPAVLQLFQQKDSRLRVLRLAEKRSLGKKAALAEGIAAARYEHLVLTDADCAPASSHWLAQMANSLAERPATEIVLGYAPLAAGSGLLNSWARFETAYTALQYFAFAHLGMPYMGVGRNLAWKRPLFQQAGGFVRHADLPSGDDDLLVNAVAQPGRVALCLEPEAFVYSAAKTTWAAWLRQKRRQLGSGLRYRWGHQVVLGAVAASQTLHYFFGLLLFVASGLRPTLMMAGFQPWFAATVFLPGWVLGLWLLRLLVVLIVWRRVLRGFRERALLVWVPLLDVLMAIYYAGFVPLAFLRGGRRVGWK
ncbi:MAG: glycosyltransferase [Saprospiraceae bacterium]